MIFRLTQAVDSSRITKDQAFSVKGQEVRDKCRPGIAQKSLHRQGVSGENFTRKSVNDDKCVSKKKTPKHMSIQ